MGVPTSEVGYTSAMPRREDPEVHKDMWGHGGGNFNILCNKDKGHPRTGHEGPERE